MEIESRDGAASGVEPAPLLEEGLPEDPMQLFTKWLDEARACAAITDYNAMCLSTVDSEGCPDARIVLLRRVVDGGLVFFTNSLSAKGRELAGHPYASATFFWDPLRRQVRIRGAVSPIAEADSDEYFASRPRMSQIGAWTSKQSSVLNSREQFEQELANTASRFGDAPIPRPPHWHGYRIAPDSVEFWQERANRLHDRFVYRRADRWARTRLYP